MKLAETPAPGLSRKNDKAREPKGGERGVKQLHERWPRRSTCETARRSHRVPFAEVLGRAWFLAPIRPAEEEGVVGSQRLAAS